MGDTTQWRVGWKKGSTWGTEVALDAAAGLYLVSESMPDGILELIPDENIGQSLSGTPMQGNFRADGGSIVEIVRYERFENRLALFMGADTNTLDGAGRLHTMPFQPASTGKFGTLGIDKALGANQQYTFPSVKLISLALSHDNGQLRAEWGCTANKLERASSVNQDTQFNLLTFQSGLMAIFNQSQVLLDEITGSEGNLTAGDERLVSAISFECNRNLEGDFVNGTKAGEIDEPQVNGFPEAMLTLTFPNYTAAVDALIKASQQRQTGNKPKRYKATVLWTGPVIGAGPETYLLALDFPSLVLESAPANAGSPGAKVPVEIAFKVVTAETVPNGSDWAWVTAGTSTFRARMRNTNASSAA